MTLHDHSRTCQGPTPAVPPAPPPLLDGAPRPLRLAVGAVEAARACGVSTRSWRRGDESGRVPLAARIGTRKVWATETLRLWLRLGCPHRDSPIWIAALKRLGEGAAA